MPWPLSPAVPVSKGAAGSIKRDYGARVACSVVRIHCSSVTLVTTCTASRSNPPCAAARRECDGGDEGANASRVIGRARAEGWGEQSRNLRKCLSASSLRKCLSAGASCALALSPAVPLSKGAAGSIKRGYGARVECSVVRIHCSSVTLVTTCAASRSNPPCAAARRECDGGRGDEGANAWVNLT